MRGRGGGGVFAKRRWGNDNPAPVKPESIEQVYYPPRTYFPSGADGGDGFAGGIDVPSISPLTLNRCPPSPLLLALRGPQGKHTPQARSWEQVIIATDLVLKSKAVENVRDRVALPPELTEDGPIRAAKRRRLEKPIKRGALVISSTAPAAKPAANVAKRANAAAADKKKKFLDDAAQEAKKGEDDDALTEDGEDDIQSISSFSNADDDDDGAESGGEDDDLLM